MWIKSIETIMLLHGFFPELILLFASITQSYTDNPWSRRLPMSVFTLVGLASAIPMIAKRTNGSFHLIASIGMSIKSTCLLLEAALTAIVYSSSSTCYGKADMSVFDDRNGRNVMLVRRTVTYPVLTVFNVLRVWYTCAMKTGSDE